MEEGLGVDLSQIRNSDGTWGSFTGSYEVDSPHGRIIFYIQGGRLVAIAFADDVCLVAESLVKAQRTLDLAQEYYTAASATLCAPKSIYTSNMDRELWRIEIEMSMTGDDDLEQVQVACRGWLRQQLAIRVVSWFFEVAMRCALRRWK